MSEPVLYGPGFSTYVRSARLALEEKGVAYRLEEFNFIADGLPDGYLERQPFGKVPAFEHDGLRLYETCAIARYVDEAFDGPALQPSDAAGRARMTQAVSVIDSYTYAPVVGTVVIQRLVVPMQGGTPDGALIEEAMPNVRRAMGVLDGMVAGEGCLAGGAPTLADLHLVPIVDYFRQTPEGETVLGDAPALAAWWDRMSARASVQATAPNLG